MSTDPRYVQRDDHGAIVGHFANPQPYAREAMDPDAPELAAWERDRRRASEVNVVVVLVERVAALEARVTDLERRG